MLHQHAGEFYAKILLMKKSKEVICLVYLAVAVIASTVLTIVKPTYVADATLQTLISEIVMRGILLSAILVLYFGYGYHKRFPLTKDSWVKIYWLIPCFISVFANFPFSALIQGSAVIDYPNYIWIFAFYSLSIGILEELLFRVVLLDFLLVSFQKKQHGLFLAVLLDSVIFGAYHLLNLASGAGVFATLLQVAYSFLVGGMFAISFLKTKNIVYSIILHTIFDFGGFLIPILGHGTFQDTVFWILTVACGVLAGAHCLYLLYKMDKEIEESKSVKENREA